MPGFLIQWSPEVYGDLLGADLSLALLWSDTSKVDWRSPLGDLVVFSFLLSSGALQVLKLPGAAGHSSLLLVRRSWLPDRLALVVEGPVALPLVIELLSQLMFIGNSWVCLG